MQRGWSGRRGVLPALTWAALVAVDGLGSLGAQPASVGDRASVRMVPRAVGRATRAPGVGDDSLRALALEAALAEAVAQGAAAGGVSGARRAASAPAPSPMQWFPRVLEATGSARVTKYTVLGEGPVSGAPADAYEVTVSAQVREDPVPSAPAFPVRMTLNAARFADRGAPDASDEIIATVTSDAAAHLTVFGVTDDGVDLLFPNPFAEEVRVDGGVPTEVPSELLRNRAGLRLRATLPPGSARRTELLVVVATRNPAPFLGEPAPEGADPAAVPTVRVTPATLARWLRAIPVGERAVAKASYEIVRGATGPAR